jgi:hypothetical protein
MTMDGVNYVDKITRRLADLLPDCPDDLLRFYALLVLIQGISTTRLDVHDAWSCWRTATRPDHPSLIPFTALSTQVQALDDPYVEAIREVAGELIGAGGWR